MITGSLCFTEILKSRKSCSSNSEASQSADSTSASGVARPYFCSSRGSSEPAFTPIRIETPASAAARAISPTWSSNFLMLPGLTRTAAQPASIAAKTYFGWKWMSAITGICDFRAIVGERVGVVLRRAGHPDDLAAGRGELGDLLQRRVDVAGHRRRHGLHGDRCAAADEHVADADLAGLAARREGRRGRGRQAEVDGGHSGSFTGFTMSAYSSSADMPITRIATAYATGRSFATSK